MSGYFGTNIQKQLQARVVESADWIRTTPGACNSGRFMASDDAERMGWDTIHRLLQRDGVFGFRMIPNGKLTDLAARLAERGFRLDLWDVFVADRESGLAASSKILAAGHHPDLTVGEFPSEPEDVRTVAIQRFMAENGIAPFSGSMLAGRLCRSTSVVLAIRSGTIVATAYGYLGHNPFSPYQAHAFGGLVAVSEAHRGKKLGVFANAVMVSRVFSILKASHVYELVTETNLPSRRMVEACGLVLDPTVKAGVATLADGARFTR